MISEDLKSIKISSGCHSPIIDILKLSNPNAKCVSPCRAAGAGPPPWNSVNLVVQACCTRYKLVTRLLKVRTVTFHVTLHENGSLCGWRVRIWTEAGREPICAEERMDLSHNIILYCRQQSLTSDSLIQWKSRKVQQDMRSYRLTFLLCADETRPTCCR